MSFRCNLVKVDPSISEGKQLLEQAEKLLNELIEMGLRVSETVIEYHDTPMIYVSEAPIASNDGDSAEEKMVLSIQNTITERNLAELVQLHGYYVFIGGLEKQKVRMALLGWSANICQDHKVIIAMDNGRSVTFHTPQPDDLLWIEQRITRAECRRTLYACMSEFEEVGIDVTLQDYSFKFTLHENDPEITRNLTHENVEEIIKIARALAH